MRKIVMTGLAAAAAVLGSIIPAAAASAGTRTTTVPATAAGPATVFYADLAGLGDRISCASPTACLAVGSSADGELGVGVAYALHGTAWRSVAVKAPKGAQDTALRAVSCKAATYCLVIGAYDDKNFVAHPAAWTWNGTTLTPAAAPPLPKALNFSSLASVSCVAVKSCVAVSTAASHGVPDGGDVQLIWTWNGAKWALKTATLPGSGAGAQLTAVHCFSLTSCEVAGSGPTDTSAGADIVMAATWNGKQFTLQRAAQPKHVSSAMVTGISCFAPGLCAVVGANLYFTNATPSGTIAGFAEIWNGKAWTVANWSGPKGSTVALLAGVSCTRRTSCLAVGAAGTGASSRAASLVWNGTHWSAVGVPSSGKGMSSEFEDVSCPKTGHCVAFGQFGKFTASITKPLAGYWNGKAWKLKAA